MRGLAPEDEYDDYAAVLQRLVDAGATADSIFAYLCEVRAALLMMAPDPAEDRRIAALIKASS